MHATGILGHIAADGAGDLRGGIGGVEQAMRRGRFGNGQVAHTGLDTGGTAVRVHVPDPVEAGHRHQHAAGMGQGTAGEPRASPARHQWHVQRTAEADDGLHLRFGVGNDHHQGQLAISTQAVAFVRTQVFLAVQDTARRQDLLQALDELTRLPGRQRAGNVLPRLLALLKPWQGKCLRLGVHRLRVVAQGRHTGMHYRRMQPG